MKKSKTLITAALSLSLLFPAAASAKEFSDVPTNHWAYPSIDRLSDLGIINGYKNGTYQPNLVLTRAQAAKILGGTLDYKSDPSFTPNFTDVPKDHYAYEEIKELTQHGVFSNVSKFNPDSPLTRAQMSKIIVEGMNIKIDNNDEVHFKDVPKGDWHPYITTLAEVKISHGVKPGYFGPYQNVTRAQMAAFTDRALDFHLGVKNGSIKYDPTQERYVDHSTITASIADTSADLVNKERAKAGLSALTMDTELSRLATLKAEDMVKNDYFDHTSPTYGSPFEMAKQFDYSYRSFGENIAYGYSTPDAVVEGWMNSPGHKANILHKEYNRIGSGAVKDSNGRIYWVHMFAEK
ncbi:S-layer homology domain-containing protein [Chungangia koreensis]|uniref:S-layer homology domain-containing protein n=1 Tax=Chungangia koreensis TaxID=752657 RepID=A0ABV8X3T0_9LACT